jgi:hypothetical protein
MFKYNSFSAYFFLALAMSIIYGVLGVRAAERSRDGTLGLDENGERAKFPHRQFFFVLAVSQLGSG